MSSRRTSFGNKRKQAVVEETPGSARKQRRNSVGGVQAGNVRGRDPIETPSTFGGDEEEDENGYMHDYRRNRMQPVQQHTETRGNAMGHGGINNDADVAAASPSFRSMHMMTRRAAATAAAATKTMTVPHMMTAAAPPVMRNASGAHNSGGRGGGMSAEMTRRSGGAAASDAIVPETPRDEMWRADGRGNHVHHRQQHEQPQQYTSARTQNYATPMFNGGGGLTPGGGIVPETVAMEPRTITTNGPRRAGDSFGPATRSRTPVNVMTSDSPLVPTRLPFSRVHNLGGARNAARDAGGDSTSAAVHPNMQHRHEPREQQQQYRGGERDQQGHGSSGAMHSTIGANGAARLRPPPPPRFNDGTSNGGDSGQGQPVAGTDDRFRTVGGGGGGGHTGAAMTYVNVRSPINARRGMEAPVMNAHAAISPTHVRGNGYQNTTTGNNNISVSRYHSPQSPQSPPARSTPNGNGMMHARTMSPVGGSTYTAAAATADVGAPGRTEAGGRNADAHDGASHHILQQPNGFMNVRMAINQGTLPSSSPRPNQNLNIASPARQPVVANSVLPEQDVRQRLQRARARQLQLQQQQQQQQQQGTQYRQQGTQQHINSEVATVASTSAPGNRRQHEDRPRIRREEPFVEEKDLEMKNWVSENVLNGFKAAGIHSGRLYNWQAECLSLEGVRTGRKNLVYCAPTSGGKSLVSDILMLRRLHHSGRPSLLVLPYVALCEEKRGYLEQVLKPTGHTVQVVYGGSGARDYLTQGVGIAVCTIEKANHIINQLILQERLNDLGCVVVDELHMVGDKERGYQLELMLSKLRYMAGSASSEDCTQIIGMSAMIPNMDIVAQWLDAALYETTTRPAPLSKLVKVGTKIKDSTGQVLRELPPPASDDPEYLGFLANEVASGGDAMLIFCATKNECEEYAKKLASSSVLTVPTVIPKKAIPQHFHDATQMNIRAVSDTHVDVRENRDDAVNALTKIHGHNERLLVALRAGVAFHHAGLLTEERELVELYYKMGVIRVLTATSTLAAGVNLPAKRVILHRHYVSGGRFKKNIDPVKYNQMAGRAGRSGIDSSGEAILFASGKTPERMEEELLELMNGECEHLKSCLRQTDIEERGVDREGMDRALLDVVSTNVVHSIHDLERFVKCTLFNAIDGLDMLTEDTKNSMMRLLSNRQMVEDRKNLTYRTLPMGNAAVSNMMKPDFAQLVHDELNSARTHGIIVATDLHLIYLICTGIQGDINLKVTGGESYMYKYMKQYINEGMTQANKNVVERIGIDEQFLSAKSSDGLERVRFSMKQEQRDEMARKCKRLYASLILYELCRESDESQVVENFRIESRDVEWLQEQAGIAGVKVQDFSEKMGWEDLALLFGKLRSRVSIGVKPEIAALAEIPRVKGARARALYKAGLHSPEDVVSVGNSRRIQEILIAAGVMQGVDRVEVFECNRIMKNARELVQAKQKELEKEFQLAQKVLMDNDYVMEKHQVGDGVRSSMDPTQPEYYEFTTPFIYCDSSDNEIRDLFSELQQWDELAFHLHTELVQNRSQNSIIVGIAVCGRSRRRGDYTVGYYIPLTTELPDGSTTLNMLRWERLEDIFSSRKMRKYTWDLKSQNYAYRLHFKEKSVREMQLDRIVGRRVYCQRIAAWLLGPDIPVLEDTNDRRDGPGWVSQVNNIESYIRMQPHGTVTVDSCRRVTQHLSVKSPKIVQSCKRAGYAWAAALMNRTKIIEHKLQDAEKLELNVLPLLVEAERYGIGFDSAAFKEESDALNRKIEELEKAAFAHAGMKFDLDSPGVVSDMLYKTLAIPVPPDARRGYRGDYSTKAEVLEEIRDAHPIVPVVIEYRSLTKRLSSFVSLCSTCESSMARHSLIGVPSPERSGPGSQRIRAHIMQTSSGTGRLVMDEPNLQCVPNPTRFELDTGTQEVNASQKVDANMRKVFVSRPGYSFVGGDYSQAELRLMAALSKDKNLVAAFKTKSDPFRSMAALWIDKHEDDITTAERTTCKHLAYGVLYGMGKARLARNLKCSEKQAAEHMKSLEETYPGLFKYREEQLKKCRTVGFVETLSGRRRYIPEINSSRREERSAAERKAFNSIVQGSAADMVKKAMFNLHNQVKEYSWGPMVHLVHEVHDELLYEVPDNYVDKLADFLRRRMQSAYDFGAVDMAVRIKSGKSWGTMKELNFKQ